MREIFTYGSVGGAPGNRCFYPEIGLRYRFVGDICNFEGKVSPAAAFY
jgi:hypothetical protein